ncbi:cytochrome o ubiquinol oxidase subunit I [Sphingomonas endolithica]|uniref:cytochrome o ubiquinol oxidase subunit I n=1 Tax=Sphingomonas endolithica TaxID=2972485 RepID=UPI00289ACECF|nr:cytochrome o ubiquinol oxidase subunit I [Sphingomonas sp. ZFBP2030]
MSVSDTMPETAPVSLVFGKLGWNAIPWSEPIPIVASAVVALTILGVLAWVWRKGYFPYLWREWITSVDHKRIGVMYCLLAAVMLLRGFSDALLMRSQQAIAMGNGGYLPSDHYDQVFSAHGTIMIFFVAMPFMIGLMNFAVPLQLGVRDVAFPTLNSVSFWLTASGALLINISLVIGEFAKTGWVVYPPLSELRFSPGVGVDYYLWALQISGVGTLLSGVNLVTTILKLRAPGMGYTRMPMFCWTSLASNLLIVAAFPILTATLAMLTLDRYLGFHFFTNELGGNQMMFVNLIWAWGHPEVYILILPAFGIFSEVVSTFSGKPLFGYRSMVLATMAICILSWMVWLHHFFTMGAGADVNGFFGVTTMIIAVPTGVKVFNWLFTMYGGRIRFETPMLWAIGFMCTFVIGGMTGVLLAVPPADFQLHNSVFLVAHFHNVIIGGVLFGAFAGTTYWWPKAFGFKLDETWGKRAFWLWITGFYLAFMPLYVLGLMGMTRRLQRYDVPEWQPWLIAAGVGALLIAGGIACQIIQITISIRRRHDLADVGGDPWDGRTLEWITTSPPPAYNFAVLPDVEGEEAYWGLKTAARENQKLSEQPDYQDIEIPRNTPTGVVTAFFATVMGFALIWHIWWLVILGFIGAWATFIVFAWRDRTEYEVQAHDLEAHDRARRTSKAKLLGLDEATLDSTPGAAA